MPIPQIFQPQDLVYRRPIRRPGEMPPDASLPSRIDQPSQGVALGGQGATDEGAQDPIMAAIRNQGVADLDRMGQQSVRTGTVPAKPPGLLKRVGSGLLEGLSVAPNVFDTQSPDFAQSFLGTALGSYQNVHAARIAAAQEASKQAMGERGMRIRERGAGAAEETAHAATTRANAEDYRVHHLPTTSGGGGRTLAEQEELDRIRHGYRMEEISGQGEQNRRTRRTPAGGTGTGEAGKISQVDRAILGRFDAANRAGQAAAQKATSDYNTASVGGRIQSVPRPNTDSIFSAAAHAVNPTFSADSAAAVDRILPKVRGSSNALPSSNAEPDETMRGAMDVLRRFGSSGGTTSGVRPEAQPGPSSAGKMQMRRSTQVAPGPSEQSSLPDDEIEAALGSISDIDNEEDARGELESAGYTKDEIDQIMARR